MRPNNQFTTPEHRFFFPLHAEAECHSSVDLSALPSVTVLEGEEHFVVVEENGVEVARRTDIPAISERLVAGASIRRIAAVARDYRADHRVMNSWLKADDFEVLEETSGGYKLVEGDQVLLLIPPILAYDNRKNRPTDDAASILVPAGQPIPSLSELGFQHLEGNEKYAFGGVITAEDKLVVPDIWLHGSRRKVVDWCVVNGLAQNAVEYEHFRRALYGQHESMAGVITSDRTLMAYLQYFDAKHGTHFWTDKDPIHETNRFGEPSGNDEGLLGMLGLARIHVKRSV